MLWKEGETWRSIRKSYDLMRKLGAGFRTQFVQAAFSECWVAWKLAKAGYGVRFHEGGCDVSVLLNDSQNLVRFEVKHSEDNKDPDKKGQGYASWVITRSQVEKKKFDICILIRDSLKKDEPDAAYVFTREEIAKTKPVNVKSSRLDYYLWYSEYFEDILKDEWMRMAANPLVKSLNEKPRQFEERWTNILLGKLQPFLKGNT